MDIPIGLKGLAQTTVTDTNTAQAAGSGTLRVFGTPFMLALMEKAASESLLPYLEENQSTVGTQLNVSHTSATPVGMNVRAESTVTAVERRRITFTVTAYDDTGIIGSGTHERFVIDAPKFIEKCYSKLEQGT